MKSIMATFLLAAVVAAGVQARVHLLGPTERQAVQMHAPIVPVPVTSLPDWAQSVVRGQVDAEYQVRGAVLDLNGDGQPEILLSAAPRTFDVHVPDRPLTIHTRVADAWQQVGSDAECLPQAIGAFRSDRWWDLRCRDGQVERVLRFVDGRYQMM